MKHSVIYARNNLREWTDVAYRLYKENDWYPAYWIAPDSIHESITDVFPEAVLHSTYDAGRSIPPTEYEDVDLLPLDAEVLHQYQPYEHLALRMMDRMDPGYGFDYDERIRHYYRLLRYWRTVVTDINPSLVVFPTSPHTVSYYILYAVCVEQDVEVAIFVPTKLYGAAPNYLYLRRRIDSVPSYLRKAYENLQHEDVQLTQEGEAYLNRISKPKTDDESLHSSGDTGSSLFSKQLKKVLDFRRYPDYVRMLFTEWEHTELKNKGILPENSKIIGYQNVFNTYKGNIHKKNLKDHYQELSQPLNFERKFIYFPLHYQPERATLPKGGRYHDMQIAVEMVSKCIPSDWNVLIKEHPYQLSFRGNGEQGRSTYDYDDFNDMDNVSLVPITTPSVQLIKHAEAVATVTGTAGWEAINMGTPAIIFGNAWYRVCSGTMYVENLSELRDAVQSVVDGMSVHDSDARRFAAAVESIGYRIPKKGPESHHLDSSEIVDRYVEALTEFVEL